ncbi:MAG: hypothetical protein ACRDTJ_21105 [Pseudonocardiaceae bacterium]
MQIEHSRAAAGGRGGLMPISKRWCHGDGRAIAEALNAELWRMDAVFDFEAGLADVYARAGLARPTSALPSAAMSAVGAVDGAGVRRSTCGPRGVAGGADVDLGEPAASRQPYDDRAIAEALR